jgi:hypothetical protein
MPVPYIDSLDDPLVYDQQAGFIGGQVSFPRASSLTPEQAWALRDTDLELNGVARTRFGFQAFGNLALDGPAARVQGIHFFDTPTFEALLVVAAGSLFKCGTDGAWTLVDADTFPDDAQPAYFAQINEVVYISTGGKPKFWTAADLQTPAAGTEITDGPAKLVYLVAHQYRMFAFDPDTSDSVYASLVLPDASGYATPFTMGTVAIAPFRVGEGAGDPLSAIVSWKGPNIVVFKADSTWLVDTTTTGELDGATLTSQFVIRRLSGRVGCVAHRSAAPAGNDLLFLARDGVRSLARTEADGDGAVSMPLSDPVLDVMDRRNLPVIHKAAGISWAGKYILAFPADTSLVNSAVAVLTLRSVAWQFWTGLQPVQFCTSAFNSQNQRLCMLDGRSQVAQYRDFVQLRYRQTSDYEDKIALDADDAFVATRPPWGIRTRSFDFGETINPKQGRTVEFVFDRSEAIIRAYAILDDDTNNRINLWALDGYNTGTPQVILTLTGPKLPFVLGGERVTRKRADLTWLKAFRTVAFELTESPLLSEEQQTDTGPIGLQRVTASAWLNAMETTT